MVKRLAGLQGVKRLIVLVFLVGILLCPALSAWAESTPLTPSAVRYQLEHSPSAEEAGQRIQQQSQDYKAELAKSPTPIPNAAKKAQRKTAGLAKLFQRRVQETLNSNLPGQSGER